MSIGVAAAALISTILGIWLDLQGFLVSLFATVFGLAVSVVVALVVLERMTQEQRAERWRRARGLTLHAVANHLCDVGAMTYVYLPLRDQSGITPILEGRDRPNTKTSRALAQLAAQVKQLESTSAEKSPSDLAAEFYEAVKWDLDQIQTVLTPRLVEAGADQTLVDSLMEFDQARRDLHNSIIAHKLVVTGSVVQPLLG